MAQPSKKMLRIFYSYAHEDQAYRDQLERHLSNLKRQYHLHTWFDRHIHAGDNWEEVLEEHLNTADLIFLLVSPDFLSSDYCYNKEMTRALERHTKGEAKVIPVIVRHVHWTNAPFHHIQLLPPGAQPIKSWPDPDEAFYNIVLEVEKVIQDLLRLRKANEYVEEGNALHDRERHEEAPNVFQPIETTVDLPTEGKTHVHLTDATNQQAEQRSNAQVIPISAGYCLKCKKKTNILNAHEVRLRSGRIAVSGTCSLCGALINQIQSS